MNVNRIIVQFLGNLAPTISIKFCNETYAGLFRKPRSGSLLLEFFLTIVNPFLLCNREARCNPDPGEVRQPCHYSTKPLIDIFKECKLFPLIGGFYLAVVLHRTVLILYSVLGNTLTLVVL